MRLPYVPADFAPADPAAAAVVARVRERRGGTLIPLDRALLHAPAVADGWNAFLGAVRTRSSLPASVREAAICRVAALNSAWFEWEAHAPLLRAALADEGRGRGSLDDAMEVLKIVDGAGNANGGAQEIRGWDEKHSAVIAYTDAMTRRVVVPKGTFDRVNALFSEQEVVELTATVAAYNCVSRFLVALDVGEMAEKHGIDMS